MLFMGYFRVEEASQLTAWWPTGGRRPSMRSKLAIAAVVLAVSGCRCEPEKLSKTLPPNIHVDSFAQESASKIDVLWVVDDSGSMAPRQEALARSFQSFIELFSRGKIDFRIAVTTTDIFKTAGAFKGNPKILAPNTPSLATAFAANIRVGTSGSPYEAGLQAAELALTRQADTNAPILDAISKCQAACARAGDPPLCSETCVQNNPIDFLRPGAYLYLIFVTDEEDESSQDVRYYWRSFETVKGIGNDGTVTTAAIMGDVPTNSCGATPGARYKALSDLTGGEVGSICDADFSKTLKKLATNAVGLRRKFALSLTPNPQVEMDVVIKYACNIADELLAQCESVDRDDCTGEAADAVELECRPPKGGPDGWTYEEGNNLIFFAGDSVPGLNAQVEIYYYEEGKFPPGQGPTE
jgi:hypothetical protein